MKTLIFNGSPRKNGDTAAVLDKLMKNLEGEHKMVNAYECNIRACTDCRYCWENEGCSQQDDMQEVYAYIQECDCILIASPIFFTELSGQLLAVFSRLQTYYCARHLRKESPIKKRKKGGVILVGGGNSSSDKAFGTACVILEEMNAGEIEPVVYCPNTDKTSPNENPSAMEGARRIGVFFNQK